ncbi:hypothetical protein EHV15_12635 [Paenibacillus oralis]|uniref:Uncharacterized protein n=2 Tax=Paenibacillus oralis TaxID=2490856 RepID=A0A3P3TZZ1_9BACL|nr:hypothetical protein EHV15_12635 [Paenibacillus oralis]
MHSWERSIYEMKLKHDTLSVEIEMEVRKEYKKISKHKRVLMPVLDYRVDLYVNGHKFDEDEVFVEKVFFQSLLSPGKYPMFTCTCGIFGCGGYYVDVFYEGDSVIWLTEQSPFMDKSIPAANRFVFSRNNMIEFSKQLVEKLEEVRRISESHELNFQYDREKYLDTIRNFAT